MPKILFYRDFRRFTGGDLKVWDYFNHVRATPGWEPYVRFYGESVWDETNPWNSVREHVLEDDVALEPDAHFVSGVDWRQIDGAVRPDSPTPVVNLVQHVKHADTSDTLLRHRFLPHKAIRICVSPEVAQAIEATGTVRGPMFTIPDAIDVASLERLGSGAARDLDAVVAANKQPEMGAEVTARLDAPDAASSCSTPGSRATSCSTGSRGRAWRCSCPTPRRASTSPPSRPWRSARWWSARTVWGTGPSASPA